MNSNDTGINNEQKDATVKLEDHNVNDITKTDTTQKFETEPQTVNSSENIKEINNQNSNETEQSLTQNNNYNSNPQNWRVIPSFYPGNYHSNHSVVEVNDQQQPIDSNWNQDQHNELIHDGYFNHSQPSYESKIHYDCYQNMNYTHYINQHQNLTNNIGMIDYNMAWVTQNIMPHQQIQFSINYTHNVPNSMYENQKQNYPKSNSNFNNKYNNYHRSFNYVVCQGKLAINNIFSILKLIFSYYKEHRSRENKRPNHLDSNCHTLYPNNHITPNNFLYYNNYSSSDYTHNYLMPNSSHDFRSINQNLLKIFI